MFREMKVSGLTVDPFTNTPIVLLKDLEEKEIVPIWIGFFEASAIATQLEKVQLSRPMTHDLIKSILDTLGVKVVKIEVNDLRENTFYATIHLDMDGVKYAIDARPSDAIALALRTSSPIFVKEEVIKKSRKIDLRQQKEGEEALDEFLEGLSPKDFGKYKM
ncbi:MAG: bifunctional nuclease family protein [Deltaproteobacteria bacterium]|nr:MAG: bifunctional nuclease family protein [Deltaproteobacteria bacterium]